MGAASTAARSALLNSVALVVARPLRGWWRRRLRGLRLGLRLGLWRGRRGGRRRVVVIAPAGVVRVRVLPAVERPPDRVGAWLGEVAGVGSPNRRAHEEVPDRRREGAA